jgi:hypothetical protein
MSLFQQIANKTVSFKSQLDEKAKYELQKTYSLYVENNKELDGFKKMIAVQRGSLVPSASSRFESYATGLFECVCSEQKMVILDFYVFMNKYYKLNVTFTDIRDYNDDEEILKGYFEDGGIISLSDSAIQKMKDDLKKGIHKRNKPIMKGNAIHFPNFFSIDAFHYSWYKKYCFSWNKDFITLSNCLIFFETGEIGVVKQDISSKFDWIESGKAVNTEEMFFGCSQRVISVKMFKNTKIVLKFPSKELAREFYETFELDQIN